MHFFLRIFDEFFSGFRAKFQKIVTCVAFSIKFAKFKTNQKFAENSEFCEKKFTIISELFTSVLNQEPEVLRVAVAACVNSAANFRGLDLGCIEATFCN